MTKIALEKKRGLGRGLNVLLSGSGINKLSLKPTPALPAATQDHLKLLAIEMINPGSMQPRRHFAAQALEELAASIKAQGVIQPIVVRMTANAGHYEIIAGERRWRAAQLAGLTEIPAIVKKISDDTAIAMALIENIQRADLNPLEEALALQRLIDEFSMTHEQVGTAVGKSRASISNLLRLLSLPPEIKVLIDQGELNMGHARAILTLPVNLQLFVTQKIVTQQLSVRDTEKLVQQLQTETKAPVIKSKLSPDIEHLQKNLSDKLGAIVAIKHNSRGRGKLVINYNNLDELDGILQHLL